MTFSHPLEGMEKGRTTWLSIGAFGNTLTMHDSRFKYLFAKYRMDGSCRAFPIQKRFTSRGSVSIQSYTTNAE